MPKRFNLSTVYRKDEYGNPVAVPALMGGGSSNVDLSDITDQIDGKTEKKLLTYDGTAIQDPNGNVLTFETLHKWLMDDPYFVVLVYNNYAYHPNGVSDEQIVFASSYPVDGYVQTHRITLLASGTVTQSSGVSEIAASRVSTINDTNKDSTKQYTSVKAVADYVANVIDAQESSLKDELKANTRADDSRWAMAEGSVWTSHTETVTAAEISVPENVIGVRVMSIDGLTAVVDGAFVNHTPARIGTMDIGAIIQQYFPTGMRSMGELADVLDFENQQAIINIGQYICNGSENWRATNDGYYFEMPGKMRGTNTAINAQYADMRTYGTSDRVGVFGVAGTYQTVSSWKSHLTQEPLVIHYILETPVVAPMDTMPAIEQSVEQGAVLTIVNDQNVAVAPPVTLKWYERVAAAVTEENVKTALGISADDNVATKSDFNQLDNRLSESIENISETVDEIGKRQKIKNFMDGIPVYDDSALSGSNGSVSTNTAYWITDFIPIEKDSTIKYISDKTIYKVAWFQETTYRKQTTTVGLGEFSSPSEFAQINYMRLQFRKSDVPFGEDVFVRNVDDASGDFVINGEKLKEESVEYKALSPDCVSAIVEAVNGERGTNFYFGEKISLNRRGFYLNKLISINVYENSLAQQGGAVYGDKLFLFYSGGLFNVYDLNNMELISSQNYIGNYSEIKPHCNSVSFSNAKYSESDEFPLLYLNAYNASGIPKGTCYVHRIKRNGTTYTTELIQTISIDFVDDDIWMDGESDTRPYGNFCVDAANNKLIAYTIKDTSKETAFFVFDLPLKDASNVILSKTDIKDSFVVRYFPLIQDSFIYDGKIYLSFGNSSSYENGIAVINLETHSVSSVIPNTFGVSEIESINMYDGKIVATYNRIMELRFD